MRGWTKWLFNAGALALGVLVLVLFSGYLQREEARVDAMQLDGFTVFCEGEEISGIYLDGESIWVGGRDGVKRVDMQTGEVLDWVAADLELIYAAHICASCDGAVWIGHNAGVTILYPDGRRVDHAAPALTGGRVNDILPQGDTVYVGTLQGATVFELKAGEWVPGRQLNKASGLVSDPVNIIMPVGDTLWYGAYLDSRPGGLSIHSAAGWQHITVEQGLAHPYINAILPLADEVLVASGQLTAGGLNVLRQTENGYAVTDTYNTADGIPGEKVRWLYADSAGHLWITTESDGLLLARDTGLEHPIDGVLLTEVQGLSDNEIKRIAESEQYYWLAGRYGLTRIEKTAIAALFEEE